MSREMVFMLAVQGHAIVMDMASRDFAEKMKMSFWPGCQVAKVVVEAAEFFKTLPQNANLSTAAAEFVTSYYAKSR